MYMSDLLRPEAGGHAEDVHGEVGRPAEGRAGPEDGHVCG